MPLCFRLFLPICGYHSICHLKRSPFCIQIGSGKHPDTMGQNKSSEANSFSASHPHILRKPKVSLPCSQEHATYLSPEPNESSQHPSILFFVRSILIFILPSMPCVFQVVSFPQIYMHFSSPPYLSHTLPICPSHPP
jgi:hypothetical protein